MGGRGEFYALHCQPLCLPRWTGADDPSPPSPPYALIQRIYVCSLAAYKANLCGSDALGRFIVDVPEGKSINDTSIFTTAVRFDSRAATLSANGQPTPASASAGPFRYEVKKTGYYCVGAVPLTMSASSSEDSSSSNATSSTAYTGVVDFQNVFKGHLPAAEYPKIFFYGTLTAVYMLLGLAWAYLCFKHRADILPIQHYVSATIAFTVIEMAAISGYYRYLNSSPVSRLYSSTRDEVGWRIEPLSPPVSTFLSQTASLSKVYLTFGKRLEDRCGAISWNDADRTSNTTSHQYPYSAREGTV